MISRLLTRRAVQFALQGLVGVCVPALVLAQAGMGGPGGGMGSSGMGGGGRGHDMGAPPMHWTLDAHMIALIRADNPDDPTSLVLAARPDLKLSDSEVTAIYQVRTVMQVSQSAARSALDTLGPNPPLSSINWSHITPGGRDSLLAHCKAVAAANGQIHDAAVVAQQQLLALFTADQQKQLLALQQRVRQERNTPHDSSDSDDNRSGGGRH